MSIERFNNQEDKNIAVLLHVLSIFTWIISPLIIYLIYSGKPETSEFLMKEIKNDLNFQITMAIIAFVCGILVILLIGVLLLFVLVIFILVMEILAALKARDGEHQDFIINFKLIR